MPSGSYPYKRSQVNTPGHDEIPTNMRDGLVKGELIITVKGYLQLNQPTDWCSVSLSENPDVEGNVPFLFRPCPDEGVIKLNYMENGQFGKEEVHNFIVPKGQFKVQFQVTRNQIVTVVNENAMDGGFKRRLPFGNTRYVVFQGTLLRDVTIEYLLLSDS